MKTANCKAVLLRDDGTIPNNRLPLLIYVGALDLPARGAAAKIEKNFAANGWGGSWRNGVYPFVHYHSEAHEVLACYGGSATVQFGGPSGVTVKIARGDAVVIPAGVAHQNLGASEDFAVVGAGTTVLAAKRLGRHYVGIDLDEHYVSITRKKLEEVEYKKAKGYVYGYKGINTRRTSEGGDFAQNHTVRDDQFHFDTTRLKKEHADIMAQKENSVKTMSLFEHAEKYHSKTNGSKSHKRATRVRSKKVGKGNR